MRKVILTTALLFTFSGSFYQAYTFSTAYEGNFANEGVRRHYIGDVVEEFAKQLFESEGWTSVDAKTGRGGIDNLFVKFDKNGNVRNVLIVECKGNNSGLKQAKNKGLQMSKEWILQSIDEKISQLEKELSSETDPRKVQKLKEQLKILKQARMLVENNRYRARLLELKHLGGDIYKLVLKKIPAGIDSETLSKIKGQLEVTANKIIPLNGKGRLSRILRRTIERATKAYEKAEKFTRASTLRKVMANVTTKVKDSSKLLAKIKYLKYASIAKNALEFIPVIGSVLGAAGQISYDIYMANILERLAKEQEILKKQIQINSQKIAELALAQKKLALQVATLTDSIAQVKNQIAEIKKGIFVTGLELLRNYFSTGDIAYLNDAIAELLEARNVKNPKLEPIITLYLLNAYAEKFNKVGNIKEVQLIKEEFKHLADLTLKNPQNLNLLFTAYEALQDIPFEGKNQIIHQVVAKVLSQKLKNYRFDDAVKLTENYALLTGDWSLYKVAIKERIENYERYKNFQSPKEALEMINKYQNSLLVKEVVKYLYKNNYFDLALKVLSSKNLQDETFEIETYLSIFSYLEDTKRINALINLVEKNPTYQKTTKEAVMKFKEVYKKKLQSIKSKQVFRLNSILSL